LQFVQGELEIKPPAVGAVQQKPVLREIVDPPLPVIPHVVRVKDKDNAAATQLGKYHEPLVSG
jgi:hypothetical protein